MDRNNNNHKSNFTNDADGSLPIFQAEQSIYYNDVNVSSSYASDLSVTNDNAPYANNNNQNYMFSNENVASTSSTSQLYHPTTTPYIPHAQYNRYANEQQIPQSMQNFFPFNSYNTTPQTNRSEIYSLDIPGFKIIIVPIPSQMQNQFRNDNSQTQQ